jgi:hypothetical protein
MLNICIAFFLFLSRKISDIGIGQKCHIGASLTLIFLQLHNLADTIIQRVLQEQLGVIALLKGTSTDLSHVGSGFKPATFRLLVQCG